MDEEKNAAPQGRLPWKVKKASIRLWNLWDKTVGRVAAILGKTAAILGLVAAIVKGILLLFPPAPDCFSTERNLKELRHCVTADPSLAESARFREVHVGRILESEGQLMVTLDQYVSKDKSDSSATLLVEHWVSNVMIKGAEGDPLVPCSVQFPSPAAARSYYQIWQSAPKGKRLRFIGVVDELTASSLSLSSCLAVPI